MMLDYIEENLLYERESLSLYLDYLKFEGTCQDPISSEKKLIKIYS